MSDRISIVAEPRSVTGKKVKQLRKDGWIPAVIYGQKPPIHVKLENGLLRRALRVAGTSQLVDLVVGGKKVTVLTREIQQHATRGDLIHVDFYEVDMKGTVTSEAELVAINEALPTAEGMGVGTLALRALEIECAPDDLVSEIEVDLSLIETIDGVIYVKDLTMPKGVTALTDEETVVARFETISLEPEEGEEEEGFEPVADGVEVIKKGKEDEEDF
ncbi:MAG: 50S ribosomal protein L25 [Anaerolineales bacterium]|nr:50S ribosomal protein L25 [Anaerolineales bacterium]MCA9927834.1 50S ribosomal protein L25 [Anaerolineales bacterium]